MLSNPNRDPEVKSKLLLKRRFPIIWAHPCCSIAQFMEMLEPPEISYFSTASVDQEGQTRYVIFRILEASIIIRERLRR